MSTLPKNVFKAFSYKRYATLFRPMMCYHFSIILSCFHREASLSTLLFMLQVKMNKKHQHISLKHRTDEQEQTQILV